MRLVRLLGGRRGSATPGLRSAQAPAGAYQCPACGSTNTSYYLGQIRCNNCGWTS